MSESYILGIPCIHKLAGHSSFLYKSQKNTFYQLHLAAASLTKEFNRGPCTVFSRPYFQHLTLSVSCIVRYPTLSVPHALSTFRHLPHCHRIPVPPPLPLLYSPAHVQKVLGRNLSHLQKRQGQPDHHRPSSFSSSS